MFADQSRTFSPCSYVSNPDTQANTSCQETDPRHRHCRNAAELASAPSQRKSNTTLRWSPAVRAVRSLRFREWLSSNTRLLFSIWCFMVLCGGAAAADRQHPSLEKLARRNGLLVDLSDRPEPPLFRPIERRDSTSYAPIQASTVTLLSTGPPTAIATAEPNASPTILPQVFDSNIGNNFTSTSCPTFFEKLIADSNFQECYPLSLLLTQSNGFFQAEKSFFYVTQALDASCNVNYPQCNSLLNSLALEIQDNGNCGNDLKAENPLVQQTLDGFLAYPTLFQAGCLKDGSGNYCFANAVTNSTTVAGVYPYYLPLGIPMPGAIRPTCNTCLKDIMNIFASVAQNRSQPISQTYVTAAQQVDLSCGPGWVQEYVKSTTKSAAPRSIYPTDTITPFLGLVIFLATTLL